MIHLGHTAVVSPWGLIYVMDPGSVLFSRGRRLLTWAESLAGRRFDERAGALKVK